MKERNLKKIVIILNPIMLLFGRYTSMIASERRLHL